MKIRFQNRVNEVVERTIRPGEKIVGLRIHELIFESPEEIKQCFEEENRNWLIRIACGSFKRKAS